MEAPQGFGPRAEFWLIVDEGGRTLRVGEGGLAIFSGEGEAELYRHFQLGYLREPTWHAHRASAGELVSMLYCVCREVDVLYLDPAPELASGRLSGLIGMDRSRFIELVMDRARVPISSAVADTVV